MSAIGRDVKREVRRLRGEGWTMANAYRAAKAAAAFDEAENLGLVRWVVEPDDEPYDMSFLDAWPRKEAERTRKELRTRLKNEGVWCAGAKALDDQGRWEWVGQSPVCGFIGTDWKDSGYDTDMRLSALEEVSVRGVAQYEGHATFAGV